MKNYLPKEILRKRKRGFTMPIGPWLREGKLSDFAREVISSARKENKDIFNFRYIDRLFNEHVSGRADNKRKISCLVSFFLWKSLKRNYMNQ